MACASTYAASVAPPPQTAPAAAPAADCSSSDSSRATTVSNEAALLLSLPPVGAVAAAAAGGARVTFADTAPAAASTTRTLFGGTSNTAALAVSLPLTAGCSWRRADDAGEEVAAGSPSARRRSACSVAANVARAASPTAPTAARSRNVALGTPLSHARTCRRTPARGSTQAPPGAVALRNAGGAQRSHAAPA